VTVCRWVSGSRRFQKKAVLSFLSFMEPKKNWSWRHYVRNPSPKWRGVISHKTVILISDYLLWRLKCYLCNNRISPEDFISFSSSQNQKYGSLALNQYICQFFSQHIIIKTNHKVHVWKMCIPGTAHFPLLPLWLHSNCFCK
jgi:hypothetical protein